MGCRLASLLLLTSAMALTGCITESRLAPKMCERLEECDGPYWDDYDECLAAHTRPIPGHCRYRANMGSKCLSALRKTSCADLETSAWWFDECSEVYECRNGPKGPGGRQEPYENVAHCVARFRELQSCGTFTEYDPERECAHWAEVPCDMSDHFLCGMGSCELQDCALPPCGDIVWD